MIHSTTYVNQNFGCSYFALDLYTTLKKMKKLDKIFLDDVFYNLNSIYKSENGDAPQMQHQGTEWNLGTNTTAGIDTMFQVK